MRAVHEHNHWFLVAIMRGGFRWYTFWGGDHIKKALSPCPLEGLLYWHKKQDWDLVSRADKYGNGCIACTVVPCQLLV